MKGLGSDTDTSSDRDAASQADATRCAAAPPKRPKLAQALRGGGSAGPSEAGPLPPCRPAEQPVPWKKLRYCYNPWCWWRLSAIGPPSAGIEPAAGRRAGQGAVERSLAGRDGAIKDASV